MEGLKETTDSEENTKGDINGDDKLDLYDMSLLSEYIRCIKNLPEGISVLSEKEQKAADINCDGKVDEGDLLVYLMHLCG